MRKLVALFVVIAGAAVWAVPAFATSDPGGFIEVCKYASTTGPALTGSFSFTVNGGSPISVAVGQCSAPIAVAGSTATVTESTQPWFKVSALSYVDSDGVTHDVTAASTITVPVTAGGIQQETIVNFTNQAITGNLEICKAAAVPGMTGTASFTISGDFSANLALPSPVTVAIGACTNVLSVPAGTVTVSETPVNGQTFVTDISTMPASALVSSSLSGATADVMIGDASATAGETLVTFTNSLSSLKVCKASGGDPFETGATLPSGPYSFSVSGGGTASLSLTPGTCAIVPVRSPAGTSFTITEGTIPGTAVSRIDWNGTSVAASAANLAGRSVTFPIAAGVNVITFTNVPAPPVPLKICKLGATTGSFTFTLSPSPLVGSATVTVPAGQCALAGTFAYDQTVTIAETAVAGTVITAAAADPTSPTAHNVVLNADGTVSVTVGSYSLLGAPGFIPAIVDITNGPAPTPPAGGGTAGGGTPGGGTAAGGGAPAGGSTSTATTTSAGAAAAAGATAGAGAAASNTAATPLKTAKTAKVASVKLVSVRVHGKLNRTLVVRVISSHKTERIRVVLVARNGKQTVVYRTVATNRAAKVPNLTVKSTIKSVRVRIA